MYQKIDSNLYGTSRRETLLGQQYIVTPVVMIVSGVLDGTNGPLLYPASEISKNVEAWNGMPLTLGHPTGSARTPRTIEEYAIGEVYSVRFEKDRLIGEAWFNVENVARRSSALLSMIEAGEPIEVSTGLFLDQIPEKGTKNRKDYEAVARNYRPDHLAILVGTRGACSLDDGCGVFVKSSLRDKIRQVAKVSCGCKGKTAKEEPLLMPAINFESLPDDDERDRNYKVADHVLMLPKWDLDSP